MKMKKFVIISIFFSSICLGEKFSRQLFYTPFGSYVSQGSNSNPQQHQNVPIPISPFYTFWAGGGERENNVPVYLTGSDGQQIPVETPQAFILNPDLTYSTQHQNTYWQVPHSDETKQNIFSYYYPYPNFGTGAVDGKVPSYDGGFKRGQVENNPYKSQSNSKIIWPQFENGGIRTNAGGFVRGHVEYRPSELQLGPPQGNTGASWKGAKAHYLDEGFNRGAVESMNHFQSPENIPRGYAGSSYNVVCYVVGYSYNRKGTASYSPDNIDPTLCTHVIYAFAQLEEYSLTIRETDTLLDLQQGFYKKTVDLKKRNPALKVLLSIGGWNDSGTGKYSKLAHSSEARRKFARDSKDFLKSFGFDGLALDWLYPKCWNSDCSKGPASDKAAFTELVKEIKSVFAPEGMLVSATLSGYKEVIDAAYDVRMLSQYLDLMNVMSFDYHGSWETHTGHGAPLFEGPITLDSNPTLNANYSMEYLTSMGVDRKKLNLGVAFYGQSFTLANPGSVEYGAEVSGPGSAGEFTNQPGNLAYFEICKKLKYEGWKKVPDHKGSWGPYAHSNSEWVGFDDPVMIERKARYVKSWGFGGMFVWTVDYDDFNNVCCTGSHPLLWAIAKELLDKTPPPSRGFCSPPPQTTPEPMPVTNRPTTQSTTPFTTSTLYTTTTTRRPMTMSTRAPQTTYQPPTQTTSPDMSSTQASTESSSSMIWWVPDNKTSTQDWNWSSTTDETTSSQIVNTPSTTNAPTQGTLLPCHQPTTTSKTCQEGEFRPGKTCNTYERCHHGYWTSEQCPGGLEWSSNSHSCDWPSNAMCQMSSQTNRPTTTSTTTRRTTIGSNNVYTTNSPSGTCEEGTYSPAENCDEYYLCSMGQKIKNQCGPSLHWDKERNLCDYPNVAKCDAKKRIKLQLSIRETPCQEGSYSGDPEDCSVYYVCVHGRNVRFRCQSNLYWNQNLKACDWPYNVQCTPVEASTSAPVTHRPTRPPYPTATTERPETTTSSFRPPPPPPESTMAPILIPQQTTSQTTAPIQPSTNSDFMVVCYFTNWAWYRPSTGKYKPEDINPDLCTHIVYGFAVLGYDDLLIKPHDTWADYDNKFYEQVTALKSKGKKVTVAIGGWNDSAGDKYSRLVNNPSARSRFITNVIEFIQKNNFDGLDLDWEYPVCWQVDCSKGPSSDKQNFAAFVRELKEAFRPHGLLLSAAVSPSKSVVDAGYDVPTLSRYFDWIAVMTYDFHGQWDKKTGHVAPLYFHEEDDFYYFNANYSINYWINQGADRRKIVMGMPLYGQSFTLTNPSDHGLNAPSSGGGTAGEYTRASGFLSYYEICSRVQKDGWTVVQDPTGAMGPYAYKGNQWVSYDDVKMIKKKSQLIRDLDLGGGMIWALDLDDFRNTCNEGNYPLLSTINSVLRSPRRISNNNVSSWNKRPYTQVNIEKKDHTNVNKKIPEGLKPQINVDVCEDEPYRYHKNDCTRYYECIYGRYLEKRCPPGTYWNERYCDWKCGKNNDNSNKNKIVRTTPRPMTTRPTPHSTRPPTTMRTTWRTTRRHEPGTEHTTEKSDYCKQNWCPTQPPTTTSYPPVNVPHSDYKVVCYFTNWSWYRQGKGKYKPEDINYNLCTHIAYGFAVLNPNTLLIRPHDGWADIDNKFYSQVTALRAKGVKVVIAIGGWNDSLGDKYSRLVRDPQARRKFIENVIEFIEKWGFDGLDLDWEYPKCWQVDCEKGPESDKENFAIFVRELKEAFTPRGLSLSSAVSPSKKVIDAGYDVPAVSKYLDWIAVMTYDYHGQWDKKTGHVAPFYNHPESDNFFFNTNYSINYWISQGADRKKIVMGMPMYGQSFTLADSKNVGLNSKSYGGGTAGEFTRAQGFLAYYEICSRVQNQGWTVVYDNENEAIGPYAYKGNQWVSYDDINMIRRKSQYIKDMGLGGGMIWALDLDDFRGTCNCEEHPLLKTINRVLRNYPEPDPHCT